MQFKTLFAILSKTMSCQLKERMKEKNSLKRYVITTLPSPHFLFYFIEMSWFNLYSIVSSGNILEAILR